MIACIIEFEVREGQEEKHRAVLAPLLESVQDVDGFISKDTYGHIADSSAMLTVSYWRDRDALRTWMKHPDHIKAIRVGQQDVFAWYRIRMGEIETDKSWTARR